VEVTVTRFTVRYSGTIRDFYKAVLPAPPPPDEDAFTLPSTPPRIAPGIGTSAELAVADALRNYAASGQEI